MSSIGRAPIFNLRFEESFLVGAEHPAAKIKDKIDIIKTTLDIFLLMIPLPPKNELLFISCFIVNSCA